MSDINDIKYDDLYGEQKELCDCIGIDAYKKLVEFFGGTNVYVCKADTLLKDDRDSKIKSEFNGVNYKYLAIKYNLTERTIRQIVSPELQRMKTEPLPEQISFY